MEKNKKNIPSKYILITFVSLFVISIILAILFSVLSRRNPTDSGVIQNLKISSVKTNTRDSRNVYLVRVSGLVVNNTEESVLGGTLVIPIEGTEVVWYGEIKTFYNKTIKIDNLSVNGGSFEIDNVFEIETYSTFIPEGIGVCYMTFPHKENLELIYVESRSAQMYTVSIWAFSLSGVFLMAALVTFIATSAYIGMKNEKNDVLKKSFFSYNDDDGGIHIVGESRAVSSKGESSLESFPVKCVHCGGQIDEKSSRCIYCGTKYSHRKK